MGDWGFITVLALINLAALGALGWFLTSTIRRQRRMRELNKELSRLAEELRLLRERLESERARAQREISE